MSVEKSEYFLILAFSAHFHTGKDCNAYPFTVIYYVFRRDRIYSAAVLLKKESLKLILKLIYDSI